MRGLLYCFGILFAVCLFLVLKMALRPPPLVPGQELSDFFIQAKWLAFGGAAVVALIVFVVVGRQEGSR